MLDFYVYILRCIDGTYYTGHTDNIEARISAHEQGLIQTCYTFTRRPVKVLWQQEFATRGVLRKLRMHGILLLG
jgi:putative endonuclease